MKVHFIALVLAIVVLATSCVTYREIVIHKRIDDEYIKLIRPEEGYSHEHHIEGPFQHPYDLGKDDVHNLLQKMKMRTRGTFIKFGYSDKPKKIFSPYQMKVLKENLPKAFKEACERDIIEFCVPKSRWKSQSIRTTYGKIFIRDHKFNIFFEAIQDLGFDYDKSKYDSGELRNWKITLGPNQSFYRDYDNWLEMSLSALEFRKKKGK